MNIFKMVFKYEHIQNGIYSIHMSILMLIPLKLFFKRLTLVNIFQDVSHNGNISFLLVCKLYLLLIKFLNNSKN